VEEVARKQRKKRDPGLDEIEFLALKVTKQKIYGSQHPSGRELLELLDSRQFKGEVRWQRIRAEGRAA